MNPQMKNKSKQIKMKQDSFFGKDFIVHLNKGRSQDENYPYEMIQSSKFVWPKMSKEELLDLADFIKEFVGDN